MIPKPHNKTMQKNPDMVPYSHNPPGHTCGLPCCNEELQIQLRVRRPKTCIGIQNVDEVLADNFTFRGGKLAKDRPVLESGFFSVQQKKGNQHAAIPKFGSVSKVRTKTDDLGQHNFLKGREITLPETKDPDATNKLYLEDFYTGESDDLLDVTSDKDIEYYMMEKGENHPGKGVPYSQKDIEGKGTYPWEIVLELKTKTSPSEKTDDTNSSNYYEVLNYADSILSSSENEKSINDSVSLKRVKKFPIAKPLPEIPPKVPLANLFNHPPLHKPSEDMSGDQRFRVVKQNSTSSDKTINKYNTYSSLYSINSEKKKLENQENPKHRSLDRSYDGRKWRQDARMIDFQPPLNGNEAYKAPNILAQITCKKDFQAPTGNEYSKFPSFQASVTRKDNFQAPVVGNDDEKALNCQPTGSENLQAPNPETAIAGNEDCQASVSGNDGTESPKHTFEEKKIHSPNVKRKSRDKKRNQFERTERENEHFNIMLNSELLKLKKYFTQDDDDDDHGQTNAAFGKDVNIKRKVKDSPVTLIL